jgi:PAS domain S-box-containing protein
MVSNFFQTQLDYIFFFYGAAFLLLVPICLILKKRLFTRLAWIWLGAFGAIHGAHDWLQLLALDLRPSPLISLVRLAFLIISFVCLAEFGRASIAALRGHGPGRGILMVMTGLAALGGLAGLAGLNAATRYTLGFIGCLWAGWALFLASKTLTLGSRQLQSAALGLGVYALAAGLVPDPAPFFPASVLNNESFLTVTGLPIQLIRGLLAVWVSVSLAFFIQACLDADKDYRLRNWFRNLISGAMVGMTLIVIGGWFITQYLGDIAASLQPRSQGRLLGISFILLLSVLLTGFLTIIAIMRENEENFRQLFDSAADIFILHDKGRIIEANQQACRSLGYTRAELLGTSLFDIEVGISKEFLFELWDRRGGDVTTLSGIYQRKDGSTFPTEIRVGEVTYGGQRLRLAAARDTTEHKRAEEALRKSQENYRNLTSQLLTAQESERSRLARELHDDLTQRLAALAIEAAKLEHQAQSAPEIISAKLKILKDKLEEMTIDIHAISRRLHPAILDVLGLSEAISSECTTFARQEEIMVNFQSDGVPREVPQDVALCIYRIVQEGLRNISQHAGATVVDISLVGSDDGIHLSIMDNGGGFDPAHAKKKEGLGLSSMKERAYLIRGDFSLNSQPGQGTVIEVKVPFSRSPA